MAGACGLCACFVNARFHDLKQRVEGFYDKGYTLFSSFLGFQPFETNEDGTERVYINFSRKQMKDKLDEIKNEISQKENGQYKYKYLAILISSHGKMLEVLRSEGEVTMLEHHIACEGAEEDEYYPTHDMLNMFRDYYGIKKIFIIQACRIPEASTEQEKKSRLDYGVTIAIKDESSDCEDDQPPLAVPPYEAPEIQESKKIMANPCVPNCLVAYASPAGKESYSSRDPSYELGGGGWLPTALHSELVKIEDGTEIDFMQVLTRVNRHMSEKENRQRKKDGSIVTLKAIGSFHHQMKEKVILKVNKIN